MARPTTRPDAPHTNSDTVRGILWMLLAVAGLAVVMLSVRGLRSEMEAFQVLFLRAFVGLTVISAILAPRGFRGVRPARPALHLWRNLLHLGAQFCIFLAVTAIPLAEVTAIEYTVPMLTAMLAAVVIGERVGIHRWVGMAIGFVGVLFIVRPGFAQIPPAMLIAFGGALLFAANNVMIKVLTRTESAAAIVFAMNLIQSTVALGPAIAVWVWPEWHHAPWILGVGVAGLVVHYSMSRALALADTSVLFPLDFLRLPVIATVAFLLWGETFSPWTAVGAAIIVGSQYYAIRRESRAG